MLFTNKQEIINSKTGEQNSLEVVIAYSNKEMVVPAIAMLGDLNMFDLVTKIYSLKVVKTPEMKNPVLVFDGINDDVLNINSLYSQIMPMFDKSEEMFEKAKPQISSMLEKQLGEYGVIASEVIDAAIIHHKLETGKLNVEIAAFGATQIHRDFLEETTKYINSQKREDIFTENKFQKECTDTLMFRLPSREEMENEDIKTSEIMPERVQICEPYKYPDAYDVYYDKASSRVPKDYYPMIEGNHANNLLPIQDNEKEFYEVLTKWILNNLKIVYAEKLDSMDEKDFVLDATTESYLNMLIERVYRWHWGHSEHVPEKRKEDLNDNTEDENDGTEKSNYIFSRKPGNEDKPVYAAYESLRNFLRQASMQLSYKVYAEALIKIARWGTRKPTALAFEDYNYTFDLCKGIIGTSVGSITDYVGVVDSTGHTHVPVAAVYTKAQIADKNFARNQEYLYAAFGMPVGINFAQFYVNKKNEDKKLTLYRYLTMPEVVRELFLKKIGLDVEITPAGMYIEDNGEIRVTKEITNDRNVTYEKLREGYLAKKSSMLADPFYCKNMNDLYLELNMENGNKELDLFKVLTFGLQSVNIEQLMEEQKFSSKEELIEQFSSGRIWDMDTAIHLNVFHEMYPIYFDVAKKAVEKIKNQESFSLEDTLNWFKDSMIERDYKWETGFLNEIKQPVISMRELMARATGNTVEPTLPDSTNKSIPEETTETVEEVTETMAEETTETMAEETASEETQMQESNPTNLEKMDVFEKVEPAEVTSENSTEITPTENEEISEEEIILDEVQKTSEPEDTDIVVEKVIEQVPMTNAEFIMKNFINPIEDLKVENIFNIINANQEPIGFVHLSTGATPAENVFTILSKDIGDSYKEVFSKTSAIYISKLIFHLVRQLLNMSQNKKPQILFDSLESMRTFCEDVKSELL